MLIMKKPPWVEGGFFMGLSVSVALLGSRRLQYGRHAHFT